MATAKQKQFAFEYTRDFCAKSAAIRAGYSERSAAQQASELLDKPEVIEMIEVYKEQNAVAARLTPGFVLKIWYDIATADPRELVKVVVKPCKSCWPEGLVVTDPNPVCELCGGEGISRVVVADTSKLSGPALALYAGSKQTKDGIEIKMNSKMEAVKEIANYLGVGIRREISGPGGGAVQLEATARAEDLTDDQLAQIIQLGIQNGSLGVDQGVRKLPEPVTIEGKRLKD